MFARLSAFVIWSLVAAAAVFWALRFGVSAPQAPAYAVHAAVKAGQLVALLEDWHTARSPVHVLYPPNRYLSAKVRVFIDWAVALFERHDHLRRV